MLDVNKSRDRKLSTFSFLHIQSHHPRPTLKVQQALGRHFSQLLLKILEQ